MKGGELDLIHTTDGQQIAELRNDAENGDINMLESDFAAEIRYTMLNASEPAVRQPERTPGGRARGSTSKS